RFRPDLPYCIVLPKETWREMAIVNNATVTGEGAAGSSSASNGPPAPRSLEGLHETVPLPPASAGFWRQLRAFAGPAFLVSVGYMEPGNWGTDLQAGAVYRYDLLWVVAVSSFMAIILQIISARLGIVTGKDLAQACRDYYPAWTRWPNWLICEI